MVWSLPPTYRRRVAAEDAFEVVCVRSRITLTIPPERSIISVAKEHGIDVLQSCTEGICGTCETEVRGGVPDHRDQLLNEEERSASATMLICVSRCRQGPLLLEL